MDKYHLRHICYQQRIRHKLSEHTVHFDSKYLHVKF